MAIDSKLNYLQETKNQIKDAIIQKGVGVLDTDSFRSYANKIRQIEGGVGALEDTFLKLRTNEGTNGYGLFTRIPSTICNNEEFIKFIENFDVSKMTTFEYMFDNSNLTQLNFSNWSVNKVTDLSHMFSLSKFKKIDLSNWNTFNVKTISYMFYNMLELTQIDLTNCDTSNVKSMFYTFYLCKKLTEIKGILDVIKVTSFNGAFNSCEKLIEIRIKNLNYTGLDLSSCVELSYDSLIYLISNLVADTSVRTLKLGTTNLEKLTDEEKAIATEKNWTLA